MVLGIAIFPFVAPGADQFVNRELLFGSSFATTADSTSATGEPGEPSQGSESGPHRSMWWNWTAPASGPVRLETVGSSFDTVLGVYTGTNLSSLQPVAWNDDAGLLSTSCLTFDATAGQTYQIAVDGFDDEGGTIQLSGSQFADSMIYSSDFSILEEGAGNLTGVQGWQGLFSEDTTGIIFENEQNRAFLSDEGVEGNVSAVWLPINYELEPGDARPISVSADWSVQHNVGSCFCSYLLLFYAQDGSFLAGLEFETASSTVLRLDGVSRRVTGFPFNAWQNQQLKIWIDHKTNQWTVSLDDVTLFDRAPFSLAAPIDPGIGSISVGRTCDSAESGSISGYVSFANLVVKTVGTVPAASNPVVQRTPYLGKTHAVPGLIEAEHYDEGGAWAGYYDTTASNKSGALRTDGVDIEPNSGGFNICWFAVGEWLLYSVDLQKTSRYRVEARVASRGEGSTIRVEVDGLDISGPLVVTNTGSWSSWETVSFVTDLPAGQHDIRVIGTEASAANGGNVCNFDWINFVEIGPAETTNVPAAPSTVRVLKN